MAIRLRLWSCWTSPVPIAAFVALIVSLALPLPAAARDALPYGHGLLWKVLAKGGRAPNYVFGTVHLADKRVTTLPAPVRRALDEVENLSIEVDIGSWSLYDTQMLLLPEGRRLSDILGRKLFARVARRLGVEKGGGKDLERLKPWVVLLTLTREMAAPPRAPDDSRLPLDLLLRSIALQRGIMVFGLEETEEQFAVFDRIPLRDQVEMVRDALAPDDDNDPAEILEHMIQLYLARDLAGLEAYSEKLWRSGPKNVVESLRRRLIVDRNRVMARRMDDLLREGGAFVAVGAAHLAGEQGVLNLLARRGYRIERVY